MLNLCTASESSGHQTQKASAKCSTMSQHIYYRIHNATTEQQTSDDQKPCQLYSPVITSTCTQLLSITNISMQLMCVKTKATIK